MGYAVLSGATITGASVALTSLAFKEVVTPLRSDPRADALCRMSATVLNSSLRHMHIVGRGFYMIARGADEGDAGQVADLARISAITVSNPTAYQSALKARIAEREEAALDASLLKESLTSYEIRMKDKDSFLARNIPGFREFD